MTDVAGLVPQIRWCFLGPRPSCVHALVEDDRRAVCGRTPPWRHPGGRWRVYSGVTAVRCGRCVGVLESRTDRFTSPDGRPGWLSRPWHDLYDWLAANQVREWVPSTGLRFAVRPGVLTYTAFRWSGPRGWDVGNIREPGFAGDPVVEPRRTPLLAGPTSRVYELMHVLGFQLWEGGW